MHLNTGKKQINLPSAYVENGKRRVSLGGNGFVIQTASKFAGGSDGYGDVDPQLSNRTCFFGRNHVF